MRPKAFQAEFALLKLHDPSRKPQTAGQSVGYYQRSKTHNSHFQCRSRELLCQLMI